MDIWKKFTNFLNHPIVQLFGGSGVIAMITWFVTHISELPIWEIWLAILFSIGCILWILNQIGIWRERHKKGFAKLNDKEIEDKIHDWLDEPGFSISREINNAAFFDFVFAPIHSEIAVSVHRDKLSPSRLQIVSSINLSNDDKNKFNALNDTQKDKLLNSLRIEMARYGISYKNLQLPLENVLLGDIIFLDNSLTEYYLKSRIQFVTNVLLLYSEVIRQFFISNHV